MLGSAQGRTFCNSLLLVFSSSSHILCVYSVGSVNLVYSVYSAYFLFWCQGFWGRRYGYCSASVYCLSLHWCGMTCLPVWYGMVWLLVVSVYCLSLNSSVSWLPYCLSSVAPQTYMGLEFHFALLVEYHSLHQDSWIQWVVMYFSCQNKYKLLFDMILLPGKVPNKTAEWYIGLKSSSPPRISHVITGQLFKHYLCI